MAVTAISKGTLCRQMVLSVMLGIMHVLGPLKKGQKSHGQWCERPG